MKIKFNWGHGIFVGIVCCVSGLLLLVFLSSKERIDLVTEEYYPKTLEFEQEIQKRKNTNALNNKVSITFGDSLYVNFPDNITQVKQVEGEIWFYRPSDKDKDLKAKIVLNDSLYMPFSLKEFETGKYEVIIDWTYDGKAYLTKEILVF